MAKAYVVQKEKVFEPIKIMCVLETQRELDLFGTIFNFVPFCEMTGVEDNWCQQIRAAAQKAGGHVNNTPELYDKFKKQV